MSIKISIYFVIILIYNYISIVSLLTHMYIIMCINKDLQNPERVPLKVKLGLRIK